MFYFINKETGFVLGLQISVSLRLVRRHNPFTASLSVHFTNIDVYLEKLWSDAVSI